MSRRRLVPLVAAVVALIAVVAIAALGRPLGKHGGEGSGLPLTFWDYVFTTVLILFVLMALVAFATLFYLRRERSELTPHRSNTLRALVILFVVVGIVYVFARHVDLNRLLHPHGTVTTPTITPPGPKSGPGRPAAHHAQFEWPELVVVLGALLAVGAVFVARARRQPRLRRYGVPPHELVVALDESLDDLRTDPDLRRAIIAAYARMEKALGAAGVPRDPAEAPFEYLERVLLSLDASAGAVRRLTDLFEWARFSQHEPEPSMRDEAVDALSDVRDELRAAEPVETW